MTMTHEASLLILIPPSLCMLSTGTETSRATSSQSEAYKVPEYYQYNEFSYYDIDIKMLQHRLKQPKPGEKY